MDKTYIIPLLTLVLFAAGCSIKHPVAKDYSQYLTQNQGAKVFSKTELEANYSIDEQTANHRYEFRAATVGYAHLWIVEFGKILDATLKSKDVQEAFGRLEKSPEKGDKRKFILFTLENYEFKNHSAHISLNITLTSDGNKELDKSYHATGRSQGGKMFWGGPFAMKNAIQQSTKSALDEILGEFIGDLKRQSGRNDVTNRL